MKKLIFALIASLLPTLLMAQYKTIDIDVQDSGKQVVIDRVFTGNTIGLRANFYDGTTPLEVTNWNMTFRYGYGQYNTNGMVPVIGTNVSSNSVVFESATNVFFAANDSYYFSIVGTNSSGAVKTFARGALIEEYDPATGGAGGYPLPMPWGSYQFMTAAGVAAMIATSTFDVVVAYGTTDAMAYRGDWGNTVSQRLWQAWLTGSNAQATALGAYAAYSNLPPIPTNAWHVGETVTGAVDAPARAGVASNTAAILAHTNGATATPHVSASDRTNWDGKISAETLWQAESNSLAEAIASLKAGTGQGTWLWVDADTNYYSLSENGSNSYSSTSYSAAMNWCVTNARTTSIYTPVITIGSSLTDGGGRYYEIDAPISVGSSIGPFAITVRGAGNIGTTISPKAGYNGPMFVFTSNIYSIVRFENIRFQANGSENTNPVIDSRAAESVFVDCEWTGFRGQAILHRGYPLGGAWNRVESCWFIGNSNDYPMVDLTGAAYDWQFTDCKFSKHAATTADVMRIDGDVANVLLHGSQFRYVGTINDAAVCAVNVADATGFTGIGNTFHGWPLAAHLFRFAPAASNSYRAILKGNNVGNSYATNFVYISTNAHNIKVLMNQVDGVARSTVNHTTNSTGVWVYNAEADEAETAPYGIYSNIMGVATTLYDAITLGEVRDGMIRLFSGADGGYYKVAGGDGGIYINDSFSLSGDGQAVAVESVEASRIRTIPAALAASGTVTYAVGTTNIYIRPDGGTNTLQIDANGSMYIAVDGVTAFTVRSNGNIGVKGAANASYSLYTTGPSYFTSTLRASSFIDIGGGTVDPSGDSTLVNLTLSGTLINTQGVAQIILPTSTNGLVSGTLWNNAGTVSVMP
jgi:hypothetical protein